MIGQSSCHGRGTGIAKVLGFAQFVMRDAEVVGASHQVHACFQRLQAMGGMSTCARENSRVIDAAFKHAQAVIVLFTGDDRARLRSKLRKRNEEAHEKAFWFQPRQDQIFEAGYAFGHSPERTILVQVGRVQLFSDIDGRYIPHFTGVDVPSDLGITQSETKPEPRLKIFRTAHDVLSRVRSKKVGTRLRQQTRLFQRLS